MLKKFLIHLIPWLIFTAYLIIANREYYTQFDFGFYVFKQCMAVLQIIIVFYLNYLLLVPRFLIQKKQPILFALVLVFLLVLYSLISLGFGKFLDLFLETPYFYEYRLTGLFQSFIIPSLFIGLSTGIRLADQYYRDRYKKLLLQDQMKHIELESLKSKINPHFLYNAFNSIYSLAQTKSDKTADAVLQLSDIMRYTTYKGSETTVSIHEELEFIKTYIDFQKLRTTNAEEKIRTEITPPETDFQVSPLLLITFVENAFKHSNLVELNHPITIRFKANNNSFLFEVINEIGLGSRQDAGIGLTNLRKILRLAYPEKHELKTEVKNNFYHAQLKIELPYDN